MAAKSKTPSTSAKSKVQKVTVPLSQAPQPEERFFQDNFKSEHWMPALLLVAGAFALYGITMWYGYVLDDEMMIWKNAFVQKGFGGIAEIFSADSLMGYFQKKDALYLLEGGRYRPLSLMTFAMEVSIFGADKPGVGHFFNILLYGLTTVILYRVALGLFPIREGGKWYFSVPFIGALIFLVHPLHSECVANIKGRDEILALMFSMSALYAAMKYYDTRKVLWIALSGASLFLGMLAKENALTFLAVIPLTIWFFGRKKATTSRIPVFNVTLALLGSAVLFMIIRYMALGFMLDHGKAVSDLMNDPFLEMNISQRWATTFLTLGWYLKLLFVPHPLTHDYYPYHVPKVDWNDWRAIAGLVSNAGLGIWALLNIRKGKTMAWFILYYLITMSIVSNIFVSVGTFMNERFIFMPSVAFCLMLGWFFARQLPDWIKEKQDQVYILGLSLLSVIIGLFVFRTATRIPDWENGSKLNISAVKISEGSARSHCFYVTSLYTDKFLKAKDKSEKAQLVEEMDYHIKRSLEINPNYGAALIMKSAVATSRFEQDHQLDRLFHEFEYILEKIPYNTNFREYLDKYMKYLDGSNSDKYISFCLRVGYDYFLKKKNDPRGALHFLAFAHNRQTDDARVFSAMAEAYEALGDTKSAQNMRAKAEAAK